MTTPEMSRSTRSSPHPVRVAFNPPLQVAQDSGISRSLRVVRSQVLGSVLSAVRRSKWRTMHLRPHPRLRVAPLGAVSWPLSAPVLSTPRGGNLPPEPRHRLSRRAAGLNGAFAPIMADPICSYSYYIVYAAPTAEASPISRAIVEIEVMFEGDGYEARDEMLDKRAC